MEQTKFENVCELARLPYFDRRDENRLVLVDDTVGPIIDVHTHLALSYVLPSRVDLHRATACTEYYLPMRRRLDLDIYANKNFSPGDLRRLKLDLTLKSLTASGMRATHTVPNLSRDMCELSISHSCVLPIDFPLLSNNARNQLNAVSGRSEFIGFGSVHPFAWNVAGQLDFQLTLGARGIKVHPAVQMIGPEHPRAIRLYQLCGKRKLPVLWHCGPVDIETKRGRELSQVRRYREPIETCRDTTFILGHSGALQMEQALELAKQHENVYLEISSQSLSSIRKILAEADPRRILYGTDWPFYHQSIQLAKVLLATEDQKEFRHRVLFENAARLFGLAEQKAAPAS